METFVSSIWWVRIDGVRYIILMEFVDNLSEDGTNEKMGLWSPDR